MPKLHSFHESFDDYDCIITRHVGLDPLPSRLTLFGPANVGNSILGAQRDIEQDTFERKITSWYMRTNLHPSPELDTWLKSTTVTLTIGDKKCWSIDLHGLQRGFSGTALNQPPRQQKRVLVDLNVDDTERLIASIPDDFVGDETFWKTVFGDNKVDYSKYRPSDFVGVWIHVAGIVDIPVDSVT